MRVTTKGARAFFLWMLCAFVVYMSFIVVKTANAVNVFDQVPKLISRSTPADTAFIRGDTLFTTQMGVVATVLIRASDKVVTDTIQGINGGDTTRILGTMWVDTARVSNRLYFAVADYNTYLDSALVDSIVQQLGRFAPGGAGTGDIEGVTAGNGLSGGGITGTVTVDVKPGWGIKIDNDSVEVNATQVMDSIASAGDSNAIVYSTDRLATYTDTGLYLGDVGDSTMLWYDLTSDNIKAYVILYYADDISDSALMSKYWIETTIGDSLTANGFLTGLNSSNGISGGASQGVVSIQLEGTHFAIGSDSVKISDGGGGGRIVLTATGTPPDYNEITITENNVTFNTGTYLNGLTNTNLIIADGFKEVNTADSVYPTWNRVNAAIGAAGGGDITQVTMGNGGTESPSGGATGNVAVSVVAGTTTGLAVDADSVYITTVPDANIATTLTRDTEASGLIHDSLFANTPAYATKANVHDSVYAPGFATKANVHDTMFANTPGYATKVNVHDSLFANTPGYATKSNVHDSVYAPGFATKVNVHDSIWANTPTFGTKANIHDSLWANTPNFFRTAGNGLTSSTSTVNVVGGWSIRAFPDSIAIANVDGDSITVGTVADARIATTITRDTEASGLAHDTLWANTPGYATKANVHDSVYAPGFATKVNVHDSLFANTPAFLTRAELKDSINATKTHSGIWTLSGNWVNTTNPWAVNEGGTGTNTFTQNGILYGNATSAIGVTAQGAAGTVLHGNAGTPTFSAVVSADITDGTVALGDLASGSVDSTKIVDGGIGSGDIGAARILSSHVLDATLVGGDMATGTIDSVRLGTACVKPAEVDTTGSFVIGNLRTGARTTAAIKSNNFQSTDSDSSLKIGSAQGLIIGSNITFGTDIEDDSLVEIFIPEEWPAVLVRGFSTADIAYNDSITIRGVTDSTQGNAIRFNDSTLTSGNHRRHIQLEVDVPPDCDSLRRVIIKCQSGTYTSTTTEFFTVARLARRAFSWTLIDSAIGGSLLDKDSSAAASATDITLASNWTATPYNSFYLLLSGRRDVGTVYNYADIYEVRFIWHRTGL